MRQITRMVIATFLGIAMLFGAMPTYAVGNGYSCEEATRVAIEHNDTEESISRKVLESTDYLRKLRFGLCNHQYIKELNVKEEDTWIYPEDVIDAFEKEFGYRPNYKVYSSSKGLYDLCLTFSHDEFIWGLRIDNGFDIYSENYDGWKYDKDYFEEILEAIRLAYQRPRVDIGEDIYYTTDEIEFLLQEKYGYDVEVYIKVIVYPEYLGGITARAVVCDRFNGINMDMYVIPTTEGWRISEDEWNSFRKAHKLEVYAYYAENNIVWWTIDELKQEFEYLLGYCPEFEIWQDPILEWRKEIKISFEHLGGKRYSIDWVFEEADGTIVVTDNVVAEFMDENPEVTHLLDIQ